MNDQQILSPGATTARRTIRTIRTIRTVRGIAVCLTASSLAAAGFIGLGEASANARPSPSAWTVTPVPVPSANLIGVGGTGRPNQTWATGFTIPGNAPFAALATRWNGTSWVSTPVPVKPGPAGSFTQSRLDSGPVEIAPDNVWAVGDVTTFGNGGDPVDQALIEHWNGTAWQQTPAGVLPYSSGLYSLDALSPTNIWAGGVINGGPGLAHYDGHSWKPVVPDALTGLNPVSWVSGLSSAGPDSVWAVGPVGLSVRYDGHSWKQAPLPDLGGDESWLQNVRTDPRFGTWAVGYRVGADHVRKPLAVHWCDGAWQLVKTPAAPYTQLQDVAFTDAGPEAFGYVDSPTAAQTAYGVQLPVGATGQARPIAVPSESTDINGVLAQPGGRGLWIVGTGAATDNSTVAPFAARSKGDPADR